MADDDHVGGHMDNEDIEGQDASEFATVQQVQEMMHDMIEEAYEVQRYEMDQRMKEMKDYVVAVVKPLEEAIGELRTSCLARHAGSGAGGSSQSGDMKVSYKAFKSTSPPAFEGTTDPIKAVEWLTKIESCFELADMHGDERVKYAASCLLGGALMWWTTTSKAMEANDLKALTWDRFKDLFEDKYCPLDRMDELEAQFMQLTQGDRSVTEYEDEFLKKSLFAKHQVSTERRKIQRFVKGLKPEIREFVWSRDFPTFGKAVEAARGQEQVLALRDTESLATKKPKLTGILHQSSPQSSFKHSKGKVYFADVQDSRAPSTHKPSGSTLSYTGRAKDACKRCGKYHKGRCPVSGPVCYGCGEPGHRSFDCPRGVSQATADEAGDALDDVTGMSTIKVIVVLVLFDLSVNLYLCAT